MEIQLTLAIDVYQHDVLFIAVSWYKIYLITDYFYSGLIQKQKSYVRT